MSARISSYGVEVIGPSTIAIDGPPDPEGDIDCTSDSAGTWGTLSSGGSLPVWWQYSVWAQWYLPEDSQTGNEERLDAWVHFSNVEIPDGSTIDAAWIGLAANNPPYYLEYLDYPASYPGEIYGELDADPDIVADGTSGDSRITNLTSSSKTVPDVTSSPSGYGRGAYNWYRVDDVLQEILDDSGFTEGNSVNFFYRCLRTIRGGTGGAEVWPIAQGWYGSEPAPSLTARPPRLIVSFTAPPIEAEATVNVALSATATATVIHAGSANVSLSISAEAVPGSSLLNRLVSYWPLNEASGNALDAHGSNDLTDMNTVGAGTGKVNGARDFVAANSEGFGRASNSTLQTGNIDFTFSAWIKPDVLGGDVLAKWLDTGPNYEYVLYITASKLAWSITSSGAIGTIATVTATNFGNLSTGTWYHVVCWHDSVNDQLAISVNGTTNTVSHSAGVYVGTAEFRIGNDDREIQYFDGLIDEVGYWKKVLSSDERTTLYNVGRGLPYPFDVHYGAAAPNLSITTTASAGLILPASASVGLSVSATASGSIPHEAEASVSLTIEAEADGLAARNSGASVSLSIDATATADNPLLGGSASVQLTTACSASPIMVYAGSASPNLTITTTAAATKYKAASASPNLSVTASASPVMVYRPRANPNLTIGTSANAGVERPASASVNLSVNASANARRNQYASASVSTSIVAAATASKKLSGSVSVPLSITASASPILQAVGSASANVTLSASSSSSVEHPASGSANVTLSAIVGPTARVRHRARADVGLSTTASASPVMVYRPRANPNLTITATASPSIPHESGASIGLSVAVSSQATLQAVSGASPSMSVSATATASKKLSASASVACSITASASPVTIARTSGSSNVALSASASPVLSVALSGSTTCSTTASASAIVVYAGAATANLTVNASAEYYMPIQIAFAHALRSNGPIAAHLGNKIFPLYAPKTLNGQPVEKPYAVYSTVSTQPVHQSSGFSGLDNTTMQVVVVSDSTLEARTIAKTIRNAVVNYRGLWKAKRVQTVENVREHADDSGDAFERFLEFDVWHREPVPKLQSIALQSTNEDGIGASLKTYLEDLAPVHPVFDIRTPTEAILYELSEVPVQESDGEAGFAEHSLSLYIRSTNFVKALDLAQRIRMRMDGLTGEIDGSEVMSLSMESQSDALESSESSGDRPNFVVVQEYGANIDSM